MNSSNNRNIGKKIDVLTNKMENNETINPRDIIIETEEKLKEIIDKILSLSKGSEWDKDPNIAFGKQKREEIEKRLIDKRKNFPTHEFSDRLLDHSTILDLKQIIFKNGHEKEFQKLFPSLPRCIELLGVLGELRNLIFHHEKEVKNFQKNLVLGLSGYFKDLIENYQTGISRKVTLWGFQIYLTESEILGVDLAKQKLKNNAKRIVSAITQKINLKNKLEINPNQNHILKFNDNQLKLSFSNFTQGSTAKEGQFNQRMNVSMYSDNYEFLKQLLQDIGMKPWIFEWIIFDNSIDVIHLIQSIQEFTGKNRTSGKGYIDKILVSESMECPISDIESKKLSSTLSGGIGVPTTFRIGTGDEKIGFMKIFENFNPDIILKIMRGELSPIQIKKIVEKSYN